jgi:hypothetical protein
MAATLNFGELPSPGKCAMPTLAAHIALEPSYPAETDQRRAAGLRIGVVTPMGMAPAKHLNNTVAPYARLESQGSFI